ncbi:MAG: TPM domain-containing protein [Eubacteriales bacterium]|nr:TPM domain-containing protein [Eubacteriales bacterium]
MRKFQQSRHQLALAGFCLLLALLVSCLSPIPGHGLIAAEGSVAPAEENYRHIFDLAEELTPQEINSLESDFSDFTQRTGQNLIYVISNNMQGKATRDYAADFYDELFPEDPANGAILLLDLENRELNLVTSGSLIDIVTDYDEETVYDAAWDNLVEGYYARVGLDVRQRLDELVERGVVAGHRRVAEETIPENKISPVEGLISAIIAFIAGGGYVLRTRDSYKPQFRKLGYNFAANSLLAFTDPIDQLLKRRVRHIPVATSNSSSSSRSSRTTTTTFTSRSGRTHGGGSGRKF